MNLERLANALGDRYRIARELGAGGMATVYLARDEKHHRDVAIKVLHPDLSGAIGADRFLAEIRTTARLQHPHIVPLFDSGDADGQLYYIMPVVQGESLRDRLDRDKRLPVAEAVRLAGDVARALDYAHRAGVVHRDIKPENILLHDGQALVADFGIGKALSVMGGPTLTQAGLGIGTPAYMSPEQAVGESVDGRSDLYSLGCVLYELLAGEPPFTGANAQAVIAKRFVQTPADITSLRDGVPRPVARALQRALARTPIDRPATAGEWLAQLTAPDDPASARAAAPAQSIAVLPFASLSTDRDNEYLGDGIAEDIINALARIDGLHVAARTSAFSLKGKQLDLRTVGEQLNVATVLEGSVRKAGPRIRITAQLIDVHDGYQLWSERYDRELVDVFAVQDEIAGAIAAKLRVTFAKPDTTPMKATPLDIEVQQLMQRGRASMAQRGRPILDAIACFERVVTLAPRHATAYACLGNAYRAKAQYSLASHEECRPSIEAAFARARGLEPDNAEALGYQAIYEVGLDLGRLESARALFERALELDPRLSEIRGLYAAWGFAVLGKGEYDARAERELKRAIEDDPLNSICATIGAIGMGVLGRPAEGAAIARRATEFDPTGFGPHYSLVFCQLWTRDLEGALATLLPALDQFSRHPFLLQSLTGIFALKGDRRRAEAAHAELQARAITSRVSQYSLATSAAYLGRIDEAIEHAIASARARDGLGPMWYRWPDIEPLKAHPRYGEVIAALQNPGH
jgi:serine/threonine-protein kinase